MSKSSKHNTVNKFDLKTSTSKLMIYKFPTQNDIHYNYYSNQPDNQNLTRTLIIAISTLKELMILQSFENEKDVGKKNEIQFGIQTIVKYSKQNYQICQCLTGFIQTFYSSLKKREQKYYIFTCQFNSKKHQNVLKLYNLDGREIDFKLKFKNKDINQSEFVPILMFSFEFYGKFYILIQSSNHALYLIVPKYNYTLKKFKFFVENISYQEEYFDFQCPILDIDYLIWKQQIFFAFSLLNNSVKILKFKITNDMQISSSLTFHSSKELLNDIVLIENKEAMHEQSNDQIDNKNSKLLSDQSSFIKKSQLMSMSQSLSTQGKIDQNYYYAFLQKQNIISEQNVNYEYPISNIRFLIKENNEKLACILTSFYGITFQINKIDDERIRFNKAQILSSNRVEAVTSMDVFQNPNNTAQIILNYFQGDVELFEISDQAKNKNDIKSFIINNFGFNNFRIFLHRSQNNLYGILISDKLVQIIEFGLNQRN